MTYSNTISLESNKQIKINFNDGDLSSDAELLLIKEFARKVGLAKLIKTVPHKRLCRVQEAYGCGQPHADDLSDHCGIFRR